MEGENRAGRSYEAFQPQSFDHETDAVVPLEPEPKRDFLPLVEQGAGTAGGEPGAGFQAGPGQASGATPGGPTQTDFASIKFQRENTLLTNADEYAASIRLEAELYVKQLRAEVVALNRQAELRYEEAARVKREAEQEAQESVAQAHAQADGVRDQAYQEGLETGRQEGLNRRYEEAGVFLKQIEAILEQMERFRARVDFAVEKDGVRLAVLLARKILHQELKINKKAVLTLLAKTLAELEDTGTFRVWLNPEDYQFAVAARPALEKFLGEDQRLALRARPELAPGNVLIETDREMIDLTLAGQFHHLDSLLTQALNERETVVTRHRPSATSATHAAAHPPTPDHED